jgi:hypothetical protein
MRNFEVPCGDWIYPAKDSLSRIRYPIDHPMVAEIFLPLSEAGKRVSGESRVSAHLRGPRYLECSLRDDQKAIRLVNLRSREEPLFSLSVKVEIKFDPNNLPRISSIPDGTSYWDDQVLFASVILQAHLSKIQLPKGITFRKASIPEIESIGRW